MKSKAMAVLFAVVIAFGGAVNVLADAVSTTITVGSQPFMITADSAANKVYVTNNGDGTVSVINGATNGVAATIPTGGKPWAVAVNPATNMVYVTNNTDSTVSVINGATNSVITTVKVGGKPGDVAINAQTNKIYVVNSGSGTVSVINGATNAVTATIPVGSNPQAIALNPVTNMIYVANFGGTTVTAINGATNTVAATITVGSSPLKIAINRSTNMVYVANYGSGSVSVINGLTNSVAATVTVGSYPAALAVNTVTGKVYVANMHQSGTVSVIDGTTVGATIAVGNDPYAIDLNSFSNMVYVANMSSNTVTVINGATNATSTLATGGNPYGVAVNNLTNTAYLINTQSGTVSVITGSTPGRVIISSPADNATNVPTTTTLSWAAASRATSYQVMLSTASSFASTIMNTSVNTTTLPVTLNFATKYRWMVIPSNSGGASLGTMDSFSTLSGVLTLVAPSNGAVNLPTSVALSWATFATATAYRVQVSTASSFGTTIVDQTGAGVSTGGISLRGLSNGATYYWHANVSNGVGTSAWSATWNFAVASLPGAPVLAMPTNNTVSVTPSLTLGWGSVSGATSYGLQIATASNFATTVSDQSGLTSPSQSVNGLVPGRSYFWRANATGVGGSGPWSTAWGFSILAAPNPPTLALPQNGAALAGTAATLSWNSVAGSSYRVQYSVSSAFTPVTDTTVAGTSLKASNLTGAAYYWRVCAVNEAGPGGWSSVWNFSLKASGALPERAQIASRPAFALRHNVAAYTLVRSCQVDLRVYDLRGRKIFAFERMQPAGSYAMPLRSMVPATQLYFVVFKADGIERKLKVAGQ